jgi:hypothetical protein
MSMEVAKTFLNRALGRPNNINARIRRAGSFATQQCRVLEISRKEVRLRVVNAQNIPDNFILIFSKDDPGRHASVLWRRGTELGAEFLSANPVPPHA